jgi:hypothetical protein
MTIRGTGVAGPAERHSRIGTAVIGKGPESENLSRGRRLTIEAMIKFWHAASCNGCSLLPGRGRSSGGWPPRNGADLALGARWPDD